MIRLTDHLWIGDSADGMRLGLMRVGAVLNVARDLCIRAGWPDVEYAQVGLVDGPGNLPRVYASAVLLLADMLTRHDVMVCCHNGARSLVVSLMYLNVAARKDWTGILNMMRERIDGTLPEVNQAHITVFDSMDWKLLARAVGS